MSQALPAILFATGAAYVYPLRAAFEMARDAGCDGVELDAGPESILQGPARIAHLADRCGVAIRTVHPPLVPLPGWQRYCEIVPRLAEMALATRARTIVIHPPRALHLEAASVTELIAQVQIARRRLEGSGARILLENPGLAGPRDARYPLWHLPALHALAAECGLEMALDTAHAGSSGLPLMESYALVRDRLSHVHLSDMRTPPPPLDRLWLCSLVKHHQLPGTGHLPLGQFLAALARDGYRGDLSLEISPTSLGIWSPARARRNLTEAVAFTRSMWRSGRAGAEETPTWT